MAFPLPLHPVYLIFVYVAVGVSVFLLLAGLLYIFCSKRYRLNWWERALLEQQKRGTESSHSNSSAARPSSDCGAARCGVWARSGPVVRICCSSRHRIGSEDSSEDDAEDDVTVSRSGVAVTVSPPVVITQHSDPSDDTPDYVKQYRSVSVPGAGSGLSQSLYGTSHASSFSSSSSASQPHRNASVVAAEKDSASLETFRKHSSFSGTFPAHRVFSASDSSRDLLNSETSLRRDSYNSYSSVGSCSLSVPFATLRVPYTASHSLPQPLPQPLSAPDPWSQLDEPKSADLKGWLRSLGARCMAGVAGRGLLGRSATTTSAAPSSPSVRGAEWLQSVRKMGSSPSSPVADASEKFWVPPGVLERKRAQSLVPTLSRQGSDDGQWMLVSRSPFFPSVVFTSVRVSS